MKNSNGKKILFLGTQMARGGAQKVLLTHAQWFQNKGYQVVAGFFYDQGGLKDEWSKKYNFEILDFEAWKSSGNNVLKIWMLIRGLIKLFRFLRKIKFDAIETFTPDCNLIGIPIAYLAGIPVRVPTHHGSLDKRSRLFFQLHGKLVNSKMSSKMVVVSNRVKDSAMKIEKIKEEKIKVILNGILIKEPSLSQKEAREKLGWPQNSQILLNVGRLTKQKGQHFIIEAMPKILKEFPDAIIFIAGDGDLRYVLQNKINKNHLQDKFTLLGVRKEIGLMLQATDLFVMPSIWEGLPIALLEAMAMENGVVISDVEGIDDVITNGENGLIVPIGDVNAFAEAVNQLLADPKMSKKMGKAARKHVVENFSEDQMCKQYEQVFFPD